MNTDMKWKRKKEDAKNAHDHNVKSLDSMLALASNKKETFRDTNFIYYLCACEKTTKAEHFEWQTDWLN